MSLINNLLDLSKLEAGKEEFRMEPADILEIAKEAVLELQPIFNEKSLNAEVSNEDLRTIVRCDNYKIGQVIRNLLSNAIKFSPENGTVGILFKESSVLIDNKPIPALKITIRDQGVGIPDGELDFVFDKFSQSSRTKTGAGGTGLGLAICQQIIRAHNGRIWAENNPEGGTAFCFELPELLTDRELIKLHNGRIL